MKCKLTPEPTAAQIAAAATVKENGGTLTAEELAHSDAFEYTGSAWSGPAARRWIAERQAVGHWADVHYHPDGSIYKPRRRDG